jgi:hypothetical protein
MTSPSFEVWNSLPRSSSPSIVFGPFPFDFSMTCPSLYSQDLIHLNTHCFEHEMRRIDLISIISHANDAYRKNQGGPSEKSLRVRLKHRHDPVNSDAIVALKCPGCSNSGKTVMGWRFFRRGGCNASFTCNCLDRKSHVGSVFPMLPASAHQLRKFSPHPIERLT